MVEFRDVVKKYTDPGEALGRDPDTGDVTGLEPGTDVDPVAVVTDPAAQAALSATYAPTARKWRTGYWYGQPVFATSTAVPNEGVLTLNMLTVPRGASMSHVACEITTAGSEGALVRLGIYRLNPSDLTSSLVVDAGTVDGTVVGAHEIELPPIDPSDEEWVALLVSVVQGGATTRPTMRMGQAWQAAPLGRATSLSFMQTAAFSGYLATGVGGSLPPTAPAPNEAAQSPRLAVKAVQS